MPKPEVIKSVRFRDSGVIFAGVSKSGLDSKQDRATFEAETWGLKILMPDAKGEPRTYKIPWANVQVCYLED